MTLREFIDQTKNLPDEVLDAEMVLDANPDGNVAFAPITKLFYVAEDHGVGPSGILPQSEIDIAEGSEDDRPEDYELVLTKNTFLVRGGKPEIPGQIPPVIKAAHYGLVDFKGSVFTGKAYEGNEIVVPSRLPSKIK